MSFSNYSEFRILNAFFNAGGWPSGMESPHWVALCTDEPDEDGTNSYEMSGGGYGRVSHDGWNIATFDGQLVSYVDNDSIITFPEATDDWGIATHFALFDAETTGVFLMWGILETAYDVVSGSVPRFDVGMMKVTME